MTNDSNWWVQSPTLPKPILHENTLIPVSRNAEHKIQQELVCFASERCLCHASKYAHTVFHEKLSSLQPKASYLPSYPRSTVLSVTVGYGAL